MASHNLNIILITVVYFMDGVIDGRSGPWRRSGEVIVTVIISKDGRGLGVVVKADLLQFYLTIITAYRCISLPCNL